MSFIGVEVEQETSAPPSKKNPGSAPAPPPPKWVTRQGRLATRWGVGGGAKRRLAFQTNAKQHLRKYVHQFKLAVFFK